MRRRETSTFIRDKIGSGDQFDKHEEQDRKIESVLTRLDLNTDNKLNEIEIQPNIKKYKV